MSKSEKKHKNSYHTPIAKHSKVGSKLLPPLAQLPQMQSCSWMEQRLPEMLWAVLIAGCLEREHALTCFRSAANHILQMPEEQKIHDVTHSGLSALSDDAFDGFCRALLLHDDVAHILSAMLLYLKLPGREKWERHLSSPASDSVPILMQSVGKCLFHQSQEATDCRWVRLLCTMAAGRMRMPREIAEPIVNYPNQGDQRRIRPSIRASEIQLDMLANRKYEWSEKFWLENLEHTSCLELPDDGANYTPSASDHKR